MAGWDDYVEGEGAPLRIPTQGWEDGAVYEPGHTEEPDAPIFALGQVQFTLPSALHSLSCTSNVLVLACTGLRPTSSSSGPAQLIRIDLDRPTEVETIEIPLAASASHARTAPAPPPPSLHKVHVDPSGRHALVSTASGDNFYVFLGTLPTSVPSASSSRRAKPLARLKGAIINAVAWSTSSSLPTSTSFSTGGILLGTSTGQLLETSLLDPLLDPSAGGFSLPVPGRTSVERYVKQLYTLPERQGVVGLRYESWGKRHAVVVATATRVYQFVGEAGAKVKDEDAAVLEAVMHPYVSGDARPKTLELPGELPSSELHFFTPVRADDKTRTLPKSLAWLTGPGIYHGQLVFPSSSADVQPGDGVIDTATLVPYPSDPASLFPPDTPPLSMALTEWHFVLLYADKICAVDILTDKVVYHEPLDLPDGARPLRIASDPVRKTLWLYTEQAIYELVVRDEDRDVWKVFLGRGQWDNARRLAKTQRQRDAVLAAEADSYFAAGKFIQAAQAYAQSSKSFEEVVLRFVERDERDALRYYLVAKLERLKRTDHTQRMMLATWLVEIFLAKINELEDLAAAERASGDADNFHAERAIVEEDMQHFLKTYKDNLDKRTVFDLLGRHGRDELTLFYASVVGDHERIIQHHVAQEEWEKALQALSKQESLDLYYRFAAVLVRHAPKAAVDTFLRQPRLDVRRLIPALTSPRARTSASAADATDHLIRYLEHAVLVAHCADPAVHNTLVTLYATSPSPVAEAAFLRFLDAAPTDPATGDRLYDLDYALRVCRAHGRVQASVRIYAQLGMHERSVDLALEADDVELAKLGAEGPEDDELLRKKLWLKVARHVVGKNDIKTAMQFLESTPLLKIEDILPFFPDFVVIDDFKEEICSALEDYSAHIERLKEDMNEATRSAEAIKADIADLDSRFVVVDAGEKCGCCRQQLLTRQFYVFPCQHCFHADCLIQEVTKTLTPSQLRRMLDLQAQLAPSASSARAAAQAARSRRTLLDDTSAQGLKLAAASVQAVDQLRRLVLPDALLSAIGGALPLPAAPSLRGFPSLGGRGGGAGAQPGSTARARRADADAVSGLPKRETKESREKDALRRQLDEVIASACVLCEGAIAAVDRGFVEDGEEM
ncbi:hypothetical protein JCM3770_006235 [Rhodotorula araucariae]